MVGMSGSLHLKWCKMSHVAHARQEDALEMIQSLHPGRVEFQASWKLTGTTPMQRCWKWCALRMEPLQSHLSIWPRQRSLRLLLHAFAQKVHHLFTDTNEQITVGMELVQILMLAVCLLHGPAFAQYTGLYFAYSMLFPVTELLHHFGNESNRPQSATLPILLSCSLCICFGCIIVLLCQVAQHSVRARIFIWRARQMTLPAGFKDLIIVDAIAQMCEDQARQAERVWLLRQRGLPRFQSDWLRGPIRLRRLPATGSTTLTFLSQNMRLSVQHSVCCVQKKTCKGEDSMPVLR